MRYAFRMSKHHNQVDKSELRKRTDPPWEKLPPRRPSRRDALSLR